MNNTTTRNLTAIVVIFMAATLVVGTFATVAATQPAFAYSQKKPRQDDNKKTRDNDGSGNRNGNTLTIEECKNKGSTSGFDTATNQECENLICTHPGENATCSQEGVVKPTTSPTNRTCEQCFTTILTQAQITRFLTGTGFLSIPDFCIVFGSRENSETIFRGTLNVLGITGTTQDELIACLKEAGIVFIT
jgi:hypothetical protein